MNSSRFQVVIIGSGMSSLTCASLLAKNGYSVCVLEQHTKPGGYLHCFKRFGERFDTGAHYTGAMDKGQPFHTLLNYLGAYDPSHFVPLDPNGFDVLKFPGFEIQLPKGYPETIAKLSDRFPNEAVGIAKFYQKIREAVTYFPTYEFNDDHIDAKLVLQLMETSLASVVNSLTQNEELKAVLYAHCVLHGVKPEEISFGLHAVMLDSLIRGPYGFAKGGDALTQKLVESIEKQGGKVFTRKKVVRIETSGKIAKAIITENGERFEADWIISGAHPKVTFSLVDRPEIFSPAFRERMAKIKESIGIFGIYSLYGHPNDFNPLKNYYYFSDTKSETVFDFEQKNRKPNVAFICPSERVTSQAHPKNMALSIHAASPFEWFSEWQTSRIGKRPAEYNKSKEAYADEVFQFLNKFHPHIKEQTLKFQTSTQLTNLHYNGSEEGTAYGIYHSIQNTGARALGPTDIPNLLITGQNTLFPGILGAAISGIRTSGHILGMKHILKELKTLGQSNL